MNAATADVTPAPGRGGSAGRVPPYNVEPEESLVDAMLLSRDAYGEDQAAFDAAMAVLDASAMPDATLAAGP